MKKSHISGEIYSTSEGSFEAQINYLSQFLNMFYHHF